MKKSVKNFINILTILVFPIILAACISNKEEVIYLSCEGVETKKTQDENKLPIKSTNNIKINLRIKGKDLNDYFEKPNINNRNMQIENGQSYSIYFNDGGFVNGQEIYGQSTTTSHENGFDEVRDSFFVTELNISLLQKRISYRKFSTNSNQNIEINYSFFVDRITGRFSADKTITKDHNYMNDEKVESSGNCIKIDKKI